MRMEMNILDFSMEIKEIKMEYIYGLQKKEMDYYIMKCTMAIGKIIKEIKMEYIYG